MGCRNAFARYFMCWELGAFEVFDSMTSAGMKLFAHLKVLAFKKKISTSKAF